MKKNRFLGKEWQVGEKEQVGEEHQDGAECLFGGVAAVHAPRHARSLDDICHYRRAHGHYERRNGDPNERYCTVRQTLLHAELQTPPPSINTTTC